jgi:Protein of unknown function (DUF4446)
MDDLTSTTGIVALAAAGVAVAALLLAAFLATRIRRLRRAQTAVLGEGNEQRDLVAHAQRLETGFAQLREWVEETMEQIGSRMDGSEQRLDGAIAHSAVVRYDAYNELSGHQSSSIALLDARRTGVVLSSIVHRDQARLYVKQLHDGEAEAELSPEEQEAVDQALARPAARA